MKTIKVTIDPTGMPSMRGEGMVGQECYEKMKPVEDALSFAGGATLTALPEASMMEVDSENTQTLSI